MANDNVLAQAEAIARQAQRGEMERLVDACRDSDNRTLRSLADLYRKLNYRFD